MSCRCHSLPYLQFPHESRLPPRNVSRPRQLGAVCYVTPGLLCSAVDVGLVADSTAVGTAGGRRAGRQICCWAPIHNLENEGLYVMFDPWLSHLSGSLADYPHVRLSGEGEMKRFFVFGLLRGPGAGRSALAGLDSWLGGEDTERGEGKTVFRGEYQPGQAGFTTHGRRRRGGGDQNTAPSAPTLV